MSDTSKQTMETQEIAIKSPNDLISQAIEKGLDVEALGKLMDLQERWQANQSRKLFFEAKFLTTKTKYNYVYKFNSPNARLPMRRPN